MGLLWWKFISFSFPLRMYARFLGKHQEETDHAAIQNGMIIPVIRAIARGKKYTPWPVKCLAEAIATQRMLGRRKIPSTLYLGLAKKGSDQIIAHAWLRCGDQVITGKRGMKNFTVVSSFANQIHKLGK
jgi:hypothetical protein